MAVSRDSDRLADGGHGLAFEQLWLLAASIALIPLAWFPPIPVRGAQLSDAIGATAVVLVVATAWSHDRTNRWRALAAPFGSWRFVAIPLGTYALWALASMGAMHGSVTRLLGTWWLVALALAVALYASRSEAHATRIRRALIVAAVIGAVTGLVGALLYALDIGTPLLNHAGDLIPGHYPRIRGTMMRANALAGMLAIGLLLLADLPRRWRILVGAVLSLALVFTFSRSWIALTGAAAVYVLALGPTRSRGRDLAAIGIVLALAAVMLAVSWLDVHLDPTRPWALEITSDPGTRLVHLRDALDTIAAHPLCGIGPGRSAALGWDAHFTIANVAALMGIPAALAFVAVVAVGLYRAIRAARAGHLAARGLAAALVLCVLDALARDIEDQRAFWVLLGLAFVMRAPRSDA